MADVSLLDKGTVQKFKAPRCVDEFIESYTQISGEENINERLIKRQRKIL